MIRVLVAMGTRPEAVKLAVPTQQLRARSEAFDVMLVSTGQHREMLEQTLATFSMSPDTDLAVMRPNQSLAELSARILQGMSGLIAASHPHLVIVQGDTTTAMATAMSAFYAGVPVAHVEAGLRTFDMLAPFPEEFNRQVVARVARWHYAPTSLNRDSLLREGCGEDQIVVTGNTVVDALLWTVSRLESDREFRAQVDDALCRLLPFRRYREDFILVTGHRRESFGRGLEQICLALRDLASNHPDLQFVYPVHLNPNVVGPVESLLDGWPNIHLIAPVSYEQMVTLLRECKFVITDSGGIQEEAPTIGKPVLVTRAQTERPEGVDAGVVRLVGTSRRAIVEAAQQLLSDPDAYAAMSSPVNPYGDGEASVRIVRHLLHVSHELRSTRGDRTHWTKS
jgi:UDP-N-acetylglucosamine 2-epimerase (non-hydrolysing)